MDSITTADLENFKVIEEDYRFKRKSYPPWEPSRLGDIKFLIELINKLMKEKSNAK